MATAILLSVFLRAQHFPAALLFSRSCQNNRVTVKTSSLSSAQKHFPVGGTMGRAGNKGAPRSDERRVSPRCVFGSGIFFFYFSTDEALRPGDVLTPWGGAGFLSAPVGRGAADGNCVFLFLVWTEKTPGGARCAGTVQILSQGGGTVLSRRSLPEYTPVSPKISAAFQHSYGGKAKQHKARSCPASERQCGNAHYNCLFNYFSWTPSPALRRVNSRDRSAIKAQRAALTPV